MTDKPKLLLTIDDHKEYESKLTKLLETQLPEYLKSLVKGFHSFRVGGYIPGFNDGDPCVFSLGEPEFEIEEDKEADDADKWDESGRFKDSYEIKGRQKKICAAVQSSLGEIPSDFFTRVYGDYFQLIVTDSTIEVNEDYYPE